MQGVIQHGGSPSEKTVKPADKHKVSQWMRVVSISCNTDWSDWVLTTYILWQGATPRWRMRSLPTVRMASRSFTRWERFSFSLWQVRVTHVMMKTLMLINPIVKMHSHLDSASLSQGGSWPRQQHIKLSHNGKRRLTQNNNDNNQSKLHQNSEVTSAH